MDPTTTPPSPSLDLYIEQVTQFGDKFGPLLVKAVVLLVVVLLLTKFLGRFCSLILIKLGMPERKAMMAVTVLHVLVLLIAGKTASDFGLHIWSHTRLSAKGEETPQGSI